MTLDIGTVYIVDALSLITLGLLQLLAYATGRFERWPAYWGLSNLLLGLGPLGVMLVHATNGTLAIVLSNGLSLAGYFLLLVAIDRFSGRRRFGWRGAALLLGAAALIAVVWPQPSDFRPRVFAGTLLLAGCDIAIMCEGILLARRERLVSGWILAGTFAPTALLQCARGILTLTSQIPAGDLLAASQSPAQQWIGASVTTFVAMRGITLLLLAAERDRNLLIAIARHDPLTGAMNRNGLEHSVGLLAGARGREAAEAALLLVDIDHFKRLNDTSGHAAGDAVLQLFTSTAERQLRKHDILARHGGDEFVIVIPRTRVDEAVEVAERIRHAFDAALDGMPELQVRPTLSIGVASGNLAHDGFDGLLRHADAALYRSKHQGRNRVQAATPGISFA
ncbi:GGDEF domain-containing protein [Aliidongia dinghuensis]|uniref:diguanylate cyclase n=1 Tax=Aliidongia dinghuensis TaxID=1867774 RepID=A0A8J2YVP2_9PROT|nr:GGDEF domain-containing protein [Aliidongia dinghuensis]GGF28486.1 GGDEF domain-containing protein [Aliidongia dinghuensis]